MKVEIVSNIIIEKLVHGGQGLGTLPDGKKVFVWNALPGETVSVRLVKNKKDYAEAIAENIVTASKDRIDPVEPASFLATSPWQIINFDAENNYKRQILVDVFAQEKQELPEFTFTAGTNSLEYRNKMEFGFWGDEEGIHIAHFVRGSHGKTKVTGSKLATPSINNAVADIVQQLNELVRAGHSIRAGDIKSVILRSNQSGQVVAALFVKPKKFPKLTLPATLQGLVVYHSNPKSPASLATEHLQQEGQLTLSDPILGTQLFYDVLSFFQVNVPVFEKALTVIAKYLGSQPTIDLYSGVGSIGIPLRGTTALIELEESNIAMAKINVGDKPIDVIHASADKSLAYITPQQAVIVDPPRAGLSNDVTARIIDTKPPMIAYLSCNPSTQARDVKLLCEAGYVITYFEGFNFFPRTPHIESLAVLELKV